MKLFVWDLHGTLEQGNEDAAIEVSNLALEQFGYRQRFKSEDSRRLYGLKWYEYFEWLLPNEPHERHVELQVASFALSDSHPEIIAKYMRPADHAADILQAIHESPHRQILISNTQPSSVPMYLEALDMKKFFGVDAAFSVNAHAREAKRNKEDILRKYLKGKKFECIVVIGDSGTDLRLAQAHSATLYLYAHPGIEFRIEGGDYRIRDLRKVLQEI